MEKERWRSLERRRSLRPVPANNTGHWTLDTEQGSGDSNVAEMGDVTAT
jgi:hypothetical protein